MSRQHKINIGYLEWTPQIQEQPWLYGASPLEAPQVLGGGSSPATNAGNARFFQNVNGVIKGELNNVAWTSWSIANSNFTDKSIANVMMSKIPNWYIERDTRNGFLDIRSSANEGTISFIWYVLV